MLREERQVRGLPEELYPWNPSRGPAPAPLPLVLPSFVRISNSIPPSSSPNPASSAVLYGLLESELHAKPHVLQLGTQLLREEQRLRRLPRCLCARHPLDGASTISNLVELPPGRGPRAARARAPPAADSCSASSTKPASRSMLSKWPVERRWLPGEAQLLQSKPSMLQEEQLLWRMFGFLHTRCALE